MGGVVFCATLTTAQTWLNMPVAQTELFGAVWGRRAADLDQMTEFRLIVNQSTAGAAAAFFRAQYSDDGGNTWNNLESATTSADLIVGAGTGLKIGAWGVMESAAAGEVQLRLVGQSGDGVTDPGFRYIAIEFR